MVAEKEIWNILEEVKDPEVPVLSIIDLGIVRNVKITLPSSGAAPDTPEVRLIITPTYSGCPAMDVISMDIRLKLIEKGYRNISIEQQLFLPEHFRRTKLLFGIRRCNSKCF